MTVSNLLYKNEYKVNDAISIRIPLLSEVIERENEYYELVALLTAMPIDLMVQLDDIGIDFTQIDEYELFLLVFETIKNSDTSLIFGELDLSEFKRAINTENNTIVLRNERTGVIIDRLTQSAIADAIRKVNNLTKNIKKAGNDAARDFMIERARKKMKRRAKQKRDSETEKLIVALVNTEQFKYDFNSVLGLTIYQFNQSVAQIFHKIDYDNRMHGVYSGTVKATEMNPKDLTWVMQ